MMTDAGNRQYDNKQANFPRSPKGCIYRKRGPMQMVEAIKILKETYLLPLSVTVGRNPNVGVGNYSAGHSRGHRGNTDLKPIMKGVVTWSLIDNVPLDDRFMSSANGPITQVVRVRSS